MAQALDYAKVVAGAQEGRCMQPSHIERVILANQYKILSLLDPDYADEYDLVREALEHGFESRYMEAFHNTVHEDALTRDESILVIDAMDLYTALQVSYEKLEDEEKEGIDDRRLDFPGFDGNNETKLYAYCRFVVEQERRFTGLRFHKDRGAQDVSGALLDRYNSHMPMVELYRNRIERWKPQRDRYQLPAEEIHAILELR
jgi:uncharacterized protein